MFYATRISIRYQPDGGAAQALLQYGQDYLLEEPTTEWDLPNEQREYIGSRWAEAVPTGNAIYRLSYTVLREFPTVAQMEAGMRARELELTAGRQGTLTLYEGYHEGVPLMVTRWRATLMELQTRRIYDGGDALHMPHMPETLRGKANGSESYVWGLSMPSRVYC